jgi:hypothetical protein
MPPPIRRRPHHRLSLCRRMYPRQVQGYRHRFPERTNPPTPEGAGGGQEERGDAELSEEREWEWLFEAETHVDMFGEARNLFLTSRVGCFFFFLELGKGLILLAGRKVIRLGGCFRGVIARNRKFRRKLMKNRWRRGCSLSSVGCCFPCGLVSG